MLNDTDWGSQAQKQDGKDSEGQGAEMTLALVKQQTLN
jgi:hypothetical protein